MRTVLSTLAVFTVVTFASLAGAAHAAGTVDVTYVDPDRFTDTGRWTVDRERNLEALSTVFQGLAKQLPDGQKLQLQVLDVDLAGDVEPVGTRELRIVRGRADWPQMTLRYTLLQGDRMLKSGESHLADLGYTFGLGTVLDRGPLHYEKRMVEDWFKQSVIGPAGTTH